MVFLNMDLEGRDLEGRDLQDMDLQGRDRPGMASFKKQRLRVGIFEPDELPLQVIQAGAFS